MKRGLLFGWIVALVIFSACQANGAVEDGKGNAVVEKGNAEAKKITAPKTPCWTGTEN
ncbi:hypothetical protein [Planomicrobium sp. CPCC 101079]|uniref:hypothetical protein n=1 Tax=Planomicrobium sp. CPCC 101079 TaxID=2599618 RepID=UPI0016444D5B|nr:hypothetical protein [Planomicrobium sp. CPCC 101079]